MTWGQHGRRRSRWFGCAGIVAGLLALPVPAAADGFALTYDVYTGGLRAIRFYFELGLADPGYETRIRLETSGIVGALFSWSLEASSVGEWRDGEIALWSRGEELISATFPEVLAAARRRQPHGADRGLLGPLGEDLALDHL